tara:strand:- start:764 stop:1717 length:954 start_codon:yes stop_codon:yes gene_type:complete
MGIVTGSRQTYDATEAIKESVEDIIYNISPTDTPFMNNAGRMNVSNTTFEWQTEALPSPSDSNKQPEAEEFTASTMVDTTRLANSCQISVRNAVVSGTQNVVSQYGKTTEMAHQLMLAARILKNDVEAALVSKNPRVSGSSGTARQTRALEHWITTNDTRGTGGAQATGEAAAMTDASSGNQVALAEADVEAAMQTIYTGGGEPDVIMCGPFNKRKISDFTGRSNTRHMVDVNTVSSNVTLFASDFGDLRVMVNRKQRDRTVFLLDFEYWKVAFLRPFTRQEIAKIGDSDREQLIVEFGLTASQESASGAIFDRTTA